MHVVYSFFYIIQKVFNSLKYVSDNDDPDPFFSASLSP